MSTKVYQTIGKQIDKKLTERIKEGVSENGNNTIQRIRGELFDVLTIGDDEKSRKEIGKNIKAELEEKLEKKEEAIKEKRKSGEVPSKRKEREIIILKRLIADVDYRLRFGVVNPNISGDKNISGDINRNIYIDLDKDEDKEGNKNFDKDVVKDIVDDILDTKPDDLENNVLVLRLIKSNKYYEQIRKELSKRGKTRTNIKDFLNHLKSLHSSLVNDKKITSLEDVLLKFKVNGGRYLRLKERNLIRERFEALQPGDRIKLNDENVITVIKRSKYGNEITFIDKGQEITENFNKFLSYRCKLGDITEIIILNNPENPKNPENPENPENPKKPVILPPDNGSDSDEELIFKEDVVLSDVSESYEDMISREVENEINEDWHNTSKFNLFKRGKLFLMRGRMRKKKIKKMKENYEKTPFTNNGTINREMTKQAARHDLEEFLGKEGINRNAFGGIKREEVSLSTEAKDEFKEMCQEYVAGTISQIEFQNRFNKFIKDKLNLPKDQQFLGTNILEKLDAIKNDNTLLKTITSDLEKYLSDHNSSHFDAIRTKIDNDFKKFRRDPRFRAKIAEILGNNSELTKEQLDEKINKFIKHQKALAKASTNNLQIKLDLLTNGKGAYQTNNKDRENRLFRLGSKFDKMPRWGQALTVAGISVIAGGAAVAASGVGSLTVLGTSISGAGLIGTATMSSLVGAKTAMKKFTHHTKEQNTYEKNLTRDYENELAKMKEREKIRTEKDSDGKYTHGRYMRYKAKRQLELYGETTQSKLQNENFGNTRDIADSIYAALEHYDTLNPNDKNILNCTLLDAKARLETYREMGHNFLKSKDKNQIERDFYDLENALNLGANRILGPGATLKNISLIRAIDSAGNEINYIDLLNSYKKDYKSASKKFRQERTWLATKWGLGTAAFTFGTSAVMQAATGTGMFAKDAVAGTPGTPESIDTTQSATFSDNYGMGKYELAGGNKIFQAAQDNISGLDSSNTVTLHFGSGTDGTVVRAGSSLLDHQTYLDKLAQVKDVINGSSLSNKTDLINQLDGGFATSGFTNTDLHGMRCLEAIEETVKGAGSFAGKLNISYDAALDIDGTIAHDVTSRMSQAFLEISKVIPGTPGTEAVEAGNKWLVIGLPWFSNTFKRKNDGKAPERAPIDRNKGDDDGEDRDKDKDKPKNEGGDKDKSKDKGGDKNEPGKVLPPKKPDDPAGPTEEEKPREKITGKRKGVITRGHPISITNDKGETVIADIDNLGDGYPGSGKLLSPKETAKEYVRKRKGISSGLYSNNIFSVEDQNRLTDLNGDENAQIDYLESKIIEDRNAVENSDIKRAFDESLKISKQWINTYIKQIIGDVNAELLNKFLSDDRIHLVSDRDFINITGGSRGAVGCFRNIDGDIYVGYSYLAQYDNKILEEHKGGYYTELDFAMHNVVIHEMIHSMSTMNYFLSEGKDGKLEYDPRRLGLHSHRWGKDGKYLGETGRSLNEASTESLAWEIISRGYKSIGLDVSPFEKKWKSYQGFINVIDQLKEIDKIKNEDFWEAMLIRKKADNKDIEWDTPLFNLMGKVNGRRIEKGKIKYSRPDYYNIISNSMDFAHSLFNEGKKSDFDTKWIIDFIAKKDINILKKYITDNHKKLSDVFDKDLLTKDGKDFKPEILDAYTGR